MTNLLNYNKNCISAKKYRGCHEKSWQPRYQFVQILYDQDMKSDHQLTTIFLITLFSPFLITMV